MTTSRTGRTEPTTTRTSRPKSTLWIDYLYGNNGWVSANVEDEIGTAISIYADSGYQEVSSGTTRTPRPSI